jgi:hypothetical protein
VKIKLPVRTANLSFVAGINNRIYAFWQDLKGGLIFSSVSSESFGVLAAWSPVQSVAENFADYAIGVDPKGNVHLAWVQNLPDVVEGDAEPVSEIQSGIYHRVLESSSEVWSAPQLIFESDYYRALTGAEANIQIAIGGEIESSIVYLAWDDIPRRRIYMTKSGDGGASWDAVEVVDDPTKQLGVEQPFNVRVEAINQTVIRIWQKGVPGEYCTQVYQMSADSGNTWSNLQLMFAGLSSCPQENDLFNEFGDRILLQSEIQEAIYWLIFDGVKWSEPQVQSELSLLIDPDTLQEIQIGCKSTSVLKPDQVLVLGCGEKGNGDIWLRSRKVGSMDEWFPPPSIWAEPVVVTNPKLSEISLPLLASDPKGRLHAFWTQTEETILSTEQERFYYAYWDTVQWTKPLAILGLVDVTVLDPFDVEITEDGRILVVWNGMPKGTIYFSWANFDRAFRPSEWADPIELTNPDDEIYENSPEIMVNESGQFFVSYSVSINEGRGIYIIESADKGETWSDPVRIIDGEVNGMEVIGPSKLVGGFEDKVYLLFGRQASPFVPNIGNIYFSRKGDSEWILSEELFTQQEDDESVLWFDLLSDNTTGVHRLWQTKSSIGPAYVWHQYSSDQGLTFSVLPSLQRFSETISSVDASVDPSGKLHLVLVDQVSDGRLLLRNQIFEDGRWKIEEDINFDNALEMTLENMSAAFTSDGFFGILLAGERVNEKSEKEGMILFLERLPTDFYERPATPETEEASVPTAIPTATVEVPLESKPSPTPTPFSLTEGFVKIAPPGSGLNDPMIMGPIVGGGIALVVVVFVVVRSLGMAGARKKNL